MVNDFFVCWRARQIILKNGIFNFHFFMMQKFYFFRIILSNDEVLYLFLFSPLLRRTSCIYFGVEIGFNVPDSTCPLKNPLSLDPLSSDHLSCVALFRFIFIPFANFYDAPWGQSFLHFLFHPHDALLFLFSSYRGVGLVNSDRRYYHGYASAVFRYLMPEAGSFIFEESSRTPILLHSCGLHNW